MSNHHLTLSELPLPLQRSALERYVRPAPRAPRTYYVDTEGNDQADGLSPGTAWATLAHVATVGLVDGDTLLLKGGQTHPGQVFISIGATPTTGITVSSYGVGRATITPNDLAGEYGIRIDESSKVTIDGINVRGTGSVRSGSFPNAVATWPQVNTAIAGILLLGFTPSTWYTDVIIRHCDITACYRGFLALAADAAMTAFYRRVTIEDVHVTECGMAGIEFTGNVYGDIYSPARIFDSLVVRDCSAQQIYGDTDFRGGSGYGFYVAGDGVGCLIERCYSYMNGLYAWNGSENGSVGIQLAFCNHGVVRECETHYQFDPAARDGNGIDLDLYAVDCLVERCYIAGCQGEGLLVYTGATGSVFRHCVVQHCGQYVGGIGKGLAVRCQADATFLHCSFYGGPTITQRLMHEVVSGLRCTYVNNVFGVTNGADFGAMGSPTLVSNCYYVGSGSQFRLNIGSNDYLSLASIQAAGLDQGAALEQLGGSPTGLTANPLWLDPETIVPQWSTTGTPATFTGFDLAETSPARNTAIDAATLLELTTMGTLDFSGAPLQSEEGTGFSFGAVGERQVVLFQAGWARGANVVLSGAM